MIALSGLLTMPRFGPDAACVESGDPDLFSEERNRHYPNPVAESYCERCPVRPDCLRWALDNDEFGVWGGTTSYQRKQLKRPVERKRCPGCASENVEVWSGGQVCLACGVSWKRSKT